VSAISEARSAGDQHRRRQRQRRGSSVCRHKRPFRRGLRAAFIRCGLRLRALWTPSSGVELVPVVGAWVMD
jgi:hypothetical protein